MSQKDTKKIRYCCALAAAKGYEYVWIDTCCIDKTSSAELSEAINSMYLTSRTENYSFETRLAERLKVE